MFYQIINLLLTPFIINFIDSFYIFIVKIYTNDNHTIILRFGCS